MKHAQYILDQTSVDVRWFAQLSLLFSTSTNIISSLCYELVKRLYLLLAVKDSDANVPKNLEARAKPVSETLPFSVFTPYYSEPVLYSTSELK
ncbi:unnamed protein product [Trifolium pratense]|uniref:Uncharacterized protein n=1 Tax=Trifolium pratense TaxID=57577 RepID=A0ACB0JNP8_TRIPR|nr:unnamed protein product [Trifolium pratense]